MHDLHTPNLCLNNNIHPDQANLMKVFDYILH